MFDSGELGEILKDHAGMFTNLRRVERALRARFVGMEEQITALILAVASGEPLLFIGPPGCAKSRIIRAFCGVIGLIDEDDPGARSIDYFEYLLTPFTEPGELFGFYDIAALSRDENPVLRRDDDGMMQKAKVVFLDEVFNASSAILNSLLAIMNEGFFHDRGQQIRVRMENLFAATNTVPETAALRAFYDRFLLRCEVSNLSSEVERFPEHLRKLVRAGWKETYAHHPRQGDLTGLLDQIHAFRKRVRQLTDSGKLLPAGDDGFFQNLAQLIAHARSTDLSEMSNRRVIKMLHVMLVHRLYRAKSPSEDLSFGQEELDLLRRFALDHFWDHRAMQQMERLVVPMR